MLFVNLAKTEYIFIFNAALEFYYQRIFIQEERALDKAQAIEVTGNEEQQLC